MTPQAFKIRLVEQGTQERIGDPLEWPGLPVIGMAIVCSSGVWRVEDVQAIAIAPGALADRRGDPVLVSVIVSRGKGIFAT